MKIVMMTAGGGAENGGDKKKKPPTQLKLIGMAGVKVATKAAILIRENIMLESLPKNTSAVSLIVKSLDTRIRKRSFRYNTRIEWSRKMDMLV